MHHLPSRIRAAARIGARALIGALVLAPHTSGAQQPARADVILVNGTVLTVDANDRVAQAIAIRGSKIVAVGTTAEVERLAGPATQRIDLRGRTVTPGDFMSTTNIVMPQCFGASGSLRAASQPQSARWPPDVQIFWPLMTHSPVFSSFTARVLSDARSVPAPGSL